MKKNLVYSFSNILTNTLYPLLVFPYISRILSIENIGTYNYFNILFSYIALFSSFGIGLYASREIGKVKDDKRNRDRVTSELLTVSIFNAVISLVFIVLPIVYFSSSADKPVAILFSIMIIANAISVEWFFVAIEKQKFIFFRNFFFKIISLILIFFFVKDNNDLLLYVSIVVFSLLLNSFVNIFTVLKNSDKKTFKISFNPLHYKGLVLIFLVEITYRYYGMGDVAILERYITREELGLFTFALSIFNIVSSFLKIIATTLLPRVSYLLQSNDFDGVNELLKQSNSLIFFICLPSILFLFFGANSLAVLFGGAKFYDSGEIIKFFCPLLLITSLVNTIIFQVLYPLGKTKIIIITYLISIVINLFLNIILIPKFSFYAVIISSIISNLMAMFVFVIVERQVLNIRKIFTKNIFNYIFSFLFSFLLIYYLVNQNIDKYNVIAILSGLVLYIGILFIAKDQLLNSIINFIKKHEKV